MAAETKLKYLSLFSGIGAFEKALDNLGIPYELVGFSEIDKFAIKSYCAIHGVSPGKNLGDITQIDTATLQRISTLSPTVFRVRIFRLQDGKKDFLIPTAR